MDMGLQGSLLDTYLPVEPTCQCLRGLLSKDIKVIVLCLSVEAQLACGVFGAGGVSALGHGAGLEGP